VPTRQEAASALKELRFRQQRWAGAARFRPCWAREHSPPASPLDLPVQALRSTLLVTIPCPARTETSSTCPTLLASSGRCATAPRWMALVDSGPTETGAVPTRQEAASALKELRFRQQRWAGAARFRPTAPVSVGPLSTRAIHRGAVAHRPEPAPGGGCFRQ
jgi:hypothetical protein